MSAQQILPTGNVVAVFVSGIGRSRAGCSCGFEGPLRMASGWALYDAYTHAYRSPGCLPSEPMIVDERLTESLWRRLSPWPVAVASILLIIPADLYLLPWLQGLL